MTTPKLRHETAIEIHSSLFTAVANVIKTNPFPFRNCLNCINFRKETELCGLVNLRPPAETICYGCPQHEDIDEIPF